MREISLDAVISERIDNFRQVFVEVAGTGQADVAIELMANVILIRGFDLMLAEFFNTFHQRHPSHRPLPAP